jgi:hypothetical protein
MSPFLAVAALCVVSAVLVPVVFFGMRGRAS